MRSRFGLLVVVLALGAIALFPGAVSAQSEGAVVLKDGTCFTWLPPAPSVSTGDFVAVITPSGNFTLSCTFEGEPIEKTTVQRGFGCATPFGPTTDSHFVYTKSGHGTLTCMVKPGQ